LSPSEYERPTSLVDLGMVEYYANNFRNDMSEGCTFDQHGPKRQGFYAQVVELAKSV
jgi:hypothetical protein